MAQNSTNHGTYYNNPYYDFFANLGAGIRQRMQDRKERKALEDSYKLQNDMPQHSTPAAQYTAPVTQAAPKAYIGDSVPAYDGTPVTVTGADGKAYTYTPGEWNPVSFGNIAQRAAVPAPASEAPAVISWQPTQQNQPAFVPMPSAAQQEAPVEQAAQETPVISEPVANALTEAAAPMMEYGAPVEQATPSYNAAVDTEGYTPSAPTQEQHKTPAQLAQEQLDAAGMNPVMPAPQGASAYGRASLGQLMGNAPQTAPTQGGTPLVAMQNSLNESNAFNQLAEEAKKKELMEQMRSLKAFRGI